MRALGLDPSLLSYGYVIYDSEAVGINKIVVSGHMKTAPTMVPVSRYVQFRSLVSDLLSRYKVDVVGLESPAYGGGEFSERHFGLMMFSSEAIFEHRKDLILYDPSTLKYLATGSSRADKTDMLKHAQIDMLTSKIIQNDEVDAYHVARFATRLYMLKNGTLSPDDLVPEERRVFLERTKKTKGLLGVRIKRTAHLFRENNRYYMFSKIPHGSVNLPEKDKIDNNVVDWLAMVEGKF